MHSGARVVRRREVVKVVKEVQVHAVLLACVHPDLPAVYVIDHMITNGK